MVRFRVWRFLSALMVLVLVLQMGVLAVQPGEVIADDPVVTFPDANLEAVIREAISKPSGDIHASELAGLEALNALYREIIDLTGIEYCNNIRVLRLDTNQISDLSPLARLTALTELGLQSNQIDDLTPLIGLTNLHLLGLDSNQISDLTPLNGLSSLTYLYLQGNRISDLTPLNGLTHLDTLALSGNQINNLTPLACLTKLKTLILQNNQIDDLAPLTNLIQLTILWLDTNQISNLAPLAGLTNLNELRLDSNQISNLTPLAGLASLTWLGLQSNQISDLTPLTGLTSLTDLLLNNNQINNIAPLVSNTGLGTGDTVYLRGNPLSPTSINVHIPALQARGVTVMWDDPVVTFPDANLEAVIREAISKPSGDIYASELASLTNLTANYRGIINLSGLEYCANLSGINLNANQISNLAPLASLTNLNGLDLSNNQVSNLAPLASLTNLNCLYLGANQISELAPLVGLINLTQLSLSSNQISNLAPLAGLTNLTWLNLSSNQISNLSPLASLTNLAGLYLDINQINNLAPLASLTNLNYLVLNANQVSDLAPLASLTNLKEIRLSYNQISNLSPLANLTNLTGLYLDINQINDIAPLVNNVGLATGDFLDLRSNPLNLTSINVHIPTLQARGVTVSWDTQAPAVTTGAGIYTSPTWFYLTGNLTGMGNADTSVTPSIEYWGPADGTWTLASMTSEGSFNTPTTLQTPPGAMPAGTYTFRAKAQGDQSGTWAYGDNATFIFQPSQPYTITTTTNTGTLTLQSNLGNITSLSAIAIQTLPNWPPLLVFPHGLMYCEVSNIEPGSTVTFTLTFPVALPADIQYWKYQPGNGWFQVPIISHNGNVITIQIQDGGLGDGDGLVNGIIVDPGGVAIPAVPTPPPTPIPTPSNPLIGAGAPTSHGSSLTGTTTTQPLSLPNIQIQSASLSTSKVLPGTPVTVTANIANKGTVNGSTRINLYVNGEKDSSQGVTVESGGNRQVFFTVNRNEPGTYDVYVSGVQAGTFMVENEIDPNIILLCSCTLILISLALGIVYILRRRNYDY